MVNYKLKYIKYKIKYLDYKKNFNQKAGMNFLENDFSRFLSVVGDDINKEYTEKTNKDFNNLISDLNDYNNDKYDISEYDHIIISIGSCISRVNNVLDYIKEFIPEQLRSKKLLVLSININNDLVDEDIINIRDYMFKRDKIMLPNGKEFLKKAIYENVNFKHYFTLFPYTNEDEKKNTENVNIFISVFMYFYGKFKDKLIIINNAIFRQNPHPLHISPYLLYNVIDRLYIPINISRFEGEIMKIDFVYTSGENYKLLIKADFLLREILNYNQYDRFMYIDYNNFYVANQDNAEYTLNTIEFKKIKTLLQEGVIIYSDVRFSFI
tara:strand:+ start:774 stop:1745 length:972 start_codon:yes stop_codon:yes gene_type:complete